MFKRILSPSENQSFFLLGPRGSGKSTFAQDFLTNKRALTIDLLLPEFEAEFALNPGLLLERIQGQRGKIDWVFIDEIQKLPKLLDLVHHAIENYKLKFLLSGSSARKLKRDSANLLAGRAFVFYMSGLTYRELGEDFSLGDVLSFGSLPKVFDFTNATDKIRYLNAYCHTYLKEEIQMEQIVRKLDPFRRFLGVAAQANGEILNFSKIERQAKISSGNAQRYFEILKDTLLFDYLEPYDFSVRAQQAKHPKGYFFDVGVARALNGNLENPCHPRTFGYGKVFEHFIVSECFKLNRALEKNFQFFYLRTKDNAEIDLIVHSPTNQKTIAIEIKSGDSIASTELNSFKKLCIDLDVDEAWVVSNEKVVREFDGVIVYPWKMALDNLFG